jgi:copper(I)-binding protein
MPHFLRAAAVAASLLSAFPALADVTVKDAWVRATPGASKVTAGYAVIVNTGAAPDVLTGVRTPVSGMAHIHATVGKDGVMRMESVHELKVPAGGDVALAPGGYHIMIMGLKQGLKVGDAIPLTFTFKTQGDVTVNARVMPLSATGGGADAHKHHK